MNLQNKDHRVSSSSDFDNDDDDYDTLLVRFARLRSHTAPASTFAQAESPLSSVKSSSNWLNDERGADTYSNMRSSLDASSHAFSPPANDNKEEEEDELRVVGDW